MRDSTKRLLKKHGWRLDRALHNYLYFAWYYPYVKFVSIVLKPLWHLTWLKPLTYLGRFIFNRYHCKVLSAGDARKIFELHENIHLDSEENRKIIPFRYARTILFTDPEFIVVMDCPCKKTLGDKPENINSCIFVGSGTGAFWLDRCKKYHPRRVTQQEALDLIRSFRAKGYITQAFFKVATGGSTGIICNCHPDTCVALRASALTRKIDRTLYMSEKSGYSLIRDRNKCKKCGACVEACHFGANTMGEEGPLHDGRRCQGCELCVEKCQNGALALRLDENASILPLDMDYVRSMINKQ
ncbi:MAG: 4Fe-4S dicluster domain-containing protein [Spirochaetes bacterium]|nr:4Fe-4S dicluster domain-containing protein [Spirochaetota bacterium]